MYVIEVRQVAESATGLVLKGGKVLKFEDESKARIFGKENIEKSKYIACWEAITENTAKVRGYEIS